MIQENKDMKHVKKLQKEEKAVARELEKEERALARQLAQAERDARAADRAMRQEVKKRRIAQV